ncbi:hypothetical protein AAFF_G00180880 [Aldrovandia affinis]|uniref:Uncharacterized protein n=1 Tax=Aldrovandia affinis TaxID=143900 RepID=A0AAD7SYH8_9TELE|nr:hypothetical protein AAFF_G00180880 [Aldrovandia affinis]
MRTERGQEELGGSVRPRTREENWVIADFRRGADCAAVARGAPRRGLGRVARSRVVDGRGWARRRSRACRAARRDSAALRSVVSALAGAQSVPHASLTAGTPR